MGSGKRHGLPLPPGITGHAQGTARSSLGTSKQAWAISLWPQTPQRGRWGAREGIERQVDCHCLRETYQARPMTENKFNLVESNWDLNPTAWTSSSEKTASKLALDLGDSSADLNNTMTTKKGLYSPGSPYNLATVGEGVCFMSLNRTC